MNLVIKPMDSSLLERSLPLIEGYQHSYDSTRTVPREQNLQFFSQFFTGDAGRQFVALDGENPVGFVTLYFHPSSIGAKSYCVLNDLFTVESYRGKGVGRALIEFSVGYAKKKGFPSIEWMTRDSNRTAQRLYDSLCKEKTAWYYYVLKTEATAP